MKTRTILPIVALSILLISGLGRESVQAQAVPQAALGSAFTYQGFLRSSSGAPLSSTCNFTFKLFDSEIGSTQIGGASTASGVAVSGGYFTALVNSAGEFGGSAFTGEARWLEIAVQCTGDPGYTTLAPRQALTLAPYASYAPTAGNADTLDGQHSSAFAGSAHGHWGEGWTGSGIGLSLSGGHTGLVAVGSNTGVDGSTSTTTGIGVMGRALASTGETYGVYGSSSSLDGAGVYGSNSNFIGVMGKGLVGVWGEATSPAGYGGYFLSQAGTAGYFESIDGLGVSIYSLNSVGLRVQSNSYGDILQVGRGSDIVFRVDGYGNASVDGGYHCGNNIDDGAGDLNEDEIAPCLYDSSPADFAEMLPSANASRPLEPGDVLIIGQDGRLTLSTETYQSSVAGVYSTHPSYLGNGRMAGVEGYAPLAIAGVVPVKVCDENGAIQAGDLLTTSSLPGYAMKASPITVMDITFYPSGVIIGKALEALPGSDGIILVLVMLQ
jgi:hypothetical protein